MYWIYNQMCFTILQESNITQLHYLTIYYYSTNQHKSNVGFWWERKTGVPEEKPLRAELRNNKLNPHMMLSAEIKPGPHWWKGSALTTWTTLPLKSWILFVSFLAASRQEQWHSNDWEKELFWWAKGCIPSVSFIITT